MAHGDEEGGTEAWQTCTLRLPMSLQPNRVVSGSSTRCAGLSPCHALQCFQTATRSAASSTRGFKALTMLAMLNVAAAQHTDALNVAVSNAEASADPEHGLEIAGAELRATRAPRSRLAVALQNHGRLLGQSCNSGTTSCGVDVWCDSTTWQLEAVGLGYYSPDGDCSRSSCTSMDREVYAFTGSPSYTASGGGVDQCPWGCGAGFYDGGWGLMRTWTPPDGEPEQVWTIVCMAVGEGECSPAGSNSVFQW